MRIRFLLLAVGCWLSAASAQWLETTILLPDSLGGLSRPQCLAYNSANNTIYVGGEDGGCVLVIDGATNQKIARIPTSSSGSALCYNSQNNRIYCANDVSRLAPGVYFVTEQLKRKPQAQAVRKVVITQ